MKKEYVTPDILLETVYTLEGLATGEQQSQGEDNMEPDVKSMNGRTGRQGRNIWDEKW